MTNNAICVDEMDIWLHNYAVEIALPNIIFKSSLGQFGSSRVVFLGHRFLTSLFCFLVFKGSALQGNPFSSLQMQCAAVMMKFLVITEPPHLSNR